MIQAAITGRQAGKMNFICPDRNRASIGSAWNGGDVRIQITRSGDRWPESAANSSSPVTDFGLPPPGAPGIVGGMGELPIF